MIRLLVSNPSILIALKQAGLIEPLFKLPIEVNVTDLLYERELRDYDGQKLLKLGLKIQSLDSEIATLAMQNCQKNINLCYDEKYAFALAHKLDFILLIINPELAKLAETKGIKYYLLSFLFELMLERKVIALDFLQQGLCNIKAMTRCYLLREQAKYFLSKIT
ncbi:MULTISPECIES: hypothetical protein [Fischerella]|uniref:hypothetical protein n=1 Tax=Fischerella TaxID=1190 RepID=UPI000369B2B1|nr:MULTISPECIES: hypothetical protein [Fischerella]MBD2432403.1 hypothetical protein [Fischerella sp. FACHB-380]